MMEALAEAATVVAAAAAAAAVLGDHLPAMDVKSS